MSYLDKRRELKRKRTINSQGNVHREEWSTISHTVEKRFKTVFVGAVSKIEEAIGTLWGGDEVDEKNMTPTQLKWYEIFLELRDDIFDQGNEQKNKCMKDLNRFKSNVSILITRPEDKNDKEG